MKRHYRKYTDEQLVGAVKNSTSYAEVLRKIGLQPVGGNYQTIKLAVVRLKLDTDHFSGHAWNKFSYKDLSELRDKRSIKRYLIREQGHTCSECNLSEWLDEPIPLELDHIDGNSLNNERSNLRILCPNCHAQTETYRGKNIGKD